MLLQNLILFFRATCNCLVKWIYYLYSICVNKFCKINNNRNNNNNAEESSHSKYWNNFFYLIVAVKYVCGFIKLVALKCEYYRYSEECKPLRTIDELLNFHRLTIKWSKLIQPLVVERAKPRFLGEHFENISFSNNYNDDYDEQPHERRITASSNQNEMQHPEVLVFHDLRGNYRDDRFINGSKKWDDYRFYHWSGIDYFCYFGHDFITIPTLQWINAGHRNGVKILGTFIVESRRGYQILNEILQSREFMIQIAEAMIFITKLLKFEGWLLNVECGVSEHRIPLLYEFVEYMTKRTHEEIPNGKIFWYDSIIDNGLLQWQNELNEKNELFFDACDGILINYGWDERSLKKCVEMSQKKNREHNVFIGLDVFGRGQNAKFHSSMTVAKIKQYNLSIGIFAPGWTFEEMQIHGINIFSRHGTDLCNGTFLHRNDIFWALLWKFFYTTGPKILPFYTSFCIGSGKRLNQDGFLYSNETWFNLSEQQWQPSVPSLKYERYFEDSFNGGSCLKILPTSTNIRLFVTELPLENGIIFSYAFKCNGHLSSDIDLAFIFNASNMDGERDQMRPLENNNYQLICNANENNMDFGDKYYPRKIFNPLNGDRLKQTVIRLSERNEKILPTNATSENGWEIRYHNIYLDELRLAHITDIGITVKSNNRNVRENYLLLGAIQIHEGTQNWR